jgi:hypothetical protein
MSSSEMETAPRAAFTLFVIVCALEFAYDTALVAKSVAYMQAEQDATMATIRETAPSIHFT